MVKVFTIKEAVPVSSYGFERSQLARQEIFKSLEVEQELVLTNLENFVPNFVETLENLGFENFYHVIYDQSDLARQKPSVKKEFVEELKGIVRVEYTMKGMLVLFAIKMEVSNVIPLNYCIDILIKKSCSLFMIVKENYSKGM